MNTIELNPEVNAALSKGDYFDQIMDLHGETVRNKDGRNTFRVELNNRPYFIKLHQGIGFIEILKEISTLKWPIISARNERDAIEYLRRNGLATMKVAGYGERGLNPATLQSFIITNELTDTYTLKDVTDNWRGIPPGFHYKLELVKEVARIARCMHEIGMNHRDFYLVHFRIDKTVADNPDMSSPALFLMDLHRAQIRKRVPSRWRVKDIGALYFSAAHLPLSKRDLLRFVRYYSNKPIKQALKEDQVFWSKVVKRAQKFYRKDWKKEMPLLLGAPK